MGATTELNRVLAVALVLGVGQQVVDSAANADHADRVWVDLTKHGPGGDRVSVGS